MKRVAVVLVMIVGLLGVGFGANARNSICGIGGLEFGARHNPHLFLQEWNLGTSPILPGYPVLWFGLALANIEYQGLYGPYFKVGIPGFDLLRVQYLASEWYYPCYGSHYCYPSVQYLELKVKFPLCPPNNIPASGSFCYLYVGYGTFRLIDDNDDFQRAGPLCGVAILYFGQRCSAGAWMECSYGGIEMGFSVGGW